MDKFKALEIFISVAEARGFAAGARRCRLSAPVATKVISELESSLGVRLLNRTTRHVSLTEAGERYLEDARRIVEDMKVADASVIGLHASPVGALTITAPELFGRLYVTPVVVEYLRQNPQVKATLLLLDRMVNMAEEGVDLAVRIGNLPDSGLHATLVGHVKRVVVGAPAYFGRCGLPLEPKDLTAHTLVAPLQVNPIQEWHFGAAAQTQSVRVEPRLITTTNDSAIEAAVLGFGLTRVLSYQVADLFKEGYLLPCLREFEPEPMPVQIVHREGRGSSAKTRQFLDMAKVMISQRLAETELGSGLG